ncbi:hypothetical protein UFOVP558_37 [uncultured Caudovirales phage]|uniref:Uncharacterized protein n=1 Tax=uncultured Caudovirales phage TaxID=2100421 RepID=A0A6J5MRP1_9CAUD|nr:hypothetical protein UFOVP558_37 [uncultured Caudovirales phage]
MDDQCTIGAKGIKVKKMTQEEAQQWRIQALQLAANQRAVHENMPPQSQLARTLKAGLDKFNAFYAPLADKEGK